MKVVDNEEGPKWKRVIQVVLSQYIYYLHIPCKRRSTGWLRGLFVLGHYTCSIQCKTGPFCKPPPSCIFTRYVFHGRTLVGSGEKARLGDRYCHLHLLMSKTCQQPIRSSSFFLLPSPICTN